MKALYNQRGKRIVQSNITLTGVKYEVQLLKSLKEFVIEQSLLRGTLREKLRTVFEGGKPPTAIFLRPLDINNVTNNGHRQVARDRRCVNGKEEPQRSDDDPTLTRSLKLAAKVLPFSREKAWVGASFSQRLQIDGCIDITECVRFRNLPSCV